MTPFTFNGDYRDLEQVATFLPAFRERLCALEAAGEYRYNDSFKGHVPGIEGPNEDTAIYLLQGLDRKRANGERIAAALAEGCEPIERLDRVMKFSRVIVYDDQDRMRGSIWQEWQDARLVPETKANQAAVTGRIRGVLPKGCRTNGVLVNGRKVMVKR